MKKSIVFVVFALWLAPLFAQQTVSLPPVADSVLKGMYDIEEYRPTVLLNDRQVIIDEIINKISTDSIKRYLEILETFHNRNTISDTVSSTEGIGAARRWIHSKMKQFSVANENRLITGYLDFEQTICSVDRHRNVFGILPGLDPERKEVLIIEAHMDSRCEVVCDKNCYAPGMDDNGSGTVLVMELARVMSRLAFDRTIIFTTVTGEEQGLFGGRAWAKYLNDNEIPFMACFNNDVVGGVACGHTASPPGCSPEGDIDSTNLRIFSFSSPEDSAASSPHKQLARYIRLQQIEEINPRLSVPMNIEIHLEDDRDGRGGDHIPFHQLGLTAVRFTSANEHGDGSGLAPDRQHTTTDVLGIDTDVPADGMIDSFFVNMNYLRRNAITNGVNLGLLAISPPSPEWSLEYPASGPRVVIQNIDTLYKDYRIAVRSLGTGSLYFDTVYEVKNAIAFDLPNLTQAKAYFISVANVTSGVESLFSEEIRSYPVGMEEIKIEGFSMSSYPNPSAAFVTIVIGSENQMNNKGRLEFYDMSGKRVYQITLQLGSSRVEKGLDLSHWPSGTYQYALFVDGKEAARNRLVVTKP